MAELRRVYLDTCCFIDLVKTALNAKLTSEKQEDVWHVKKLMEAHRDGEVELFTSTLTIAESRHGGQGVINDVVKSQFNRLLMSGQYVKLVQMTPFIATDARDLTWTHGVSLKGADSIHVASAIDRKCEEMLTGNSRIVRLGREGGGLRRLGLTVIEARQTTSLPMKYRQLDLNDGQSAIH